METVRINDIFLNNGKFPLGENPTEISTGMKVVIAWEKMSKSKFNGVDPQVPIEIIFFIIYDNFI
jgi:leucyl-tRNA synthetase